MKLIQESNNIFSKSKKFEKPKTGGRAKWNHYAEQKF